MPYPAAPEIATSYTAQEQALGNGTLPGQELDVDLAAIRASVTAVIEFVKQIARSDGNLANGIVTPEALGAALIIGFESPSVWATGVAYTTRSIVFEGTRVYLCLVAHTSSDFATDLSSGRWSLLADLAGGALVTSNNLSDLPDKPTARANLGLGSMATVNSGTGASDFRTNLQNEAFFQPLDTDLTAIAGLTSAADLLPYFTGPGTAALAAFTAAGRALVDDADAAAQRTTLGLVIGTNVQAYDAALSYIAANVSDTALATQAEAEAGTAADKLMTPLRVKEALNASGAAPIYACRAWVNFNGTGTVAILAAGNVSSITDNGVGDYTVNFTTAMPDANYAMAGFARTPDDTVSQNGMFVTARLSMLKTASAMQILVKSGGAADTDVSEVCVNFFR